MFEIYWKKKQVCSILKKIYLAELLTYIWILARALYFQQGQTVQKTAYKSNERQAERQTI